MGSTLPSPTKFGILPLEPRPLLVLQLVLREWRAGRWIILVQVHVVVPTDRACSASAILGDETSN